MLHLWRPTSKTVVRGSGRDAAYKSIVNGNNEICLALSAKIILYGMPNITHIL